MKTLIPNISRPNTYTSNTYTSNTYTSNTDTPKTYTPKTSTPNSLNTLNDLNTPNNVRNKLYNAKDQSAEKVLKNNNKNQNNFDNRNNLKKTNPAKNVRSPFFSDLRVKSINSGKIKMSENSIMSTQEGYRSGLLLRKNSLFKFKYDYDLGKSTHTDASVVRFVVTDASGVPIGKATYTDSFIVPLVSTDPSEPPLYKRLLTDASGVPFVLTYQRLLVKEGKGKQVLLCKDFKVTVQPTKNKGKFRLHVTLRHRRNFTKKLLKNFKLTLNIPEQS